MRRLPSRTIALLLTLAGCAGDAQSPTDGSTPADLAPTASADLGLVPVDGGEHVHGLGPPYPIILVHGMAGFKNIGPVDYFYKIPPALEADGHQIFISHEDPINDSETRGAELAAFVEQVLAQTHKAKVNLIGHSQGGMDALYVAHTMGDRVGAVISVATPFGGSPVADAAMSGGSGANAAIDALLNLYGAVNGFDSDAQKQIAEITTAGATAFTQKYPADPRVAWFSVAGRSSMTLATDDPNCATLDRPAFVQQYDQIRDPLDVIFAIPGAIIDNSKGSPVHDGLVPVESAMHGTFLGCVPADHMDEVNQLLGDNPGPGNTFDAIQLFRDLANFLVWAGY